ncbi:MAG: GNAT family N-acetyltransferase [Deltaproteobacteria bacterium]|nr:GNAT family N-acetyltransferase [Deltaproteobacteria bacterium]MBW2341131.1 GNAT family N-acetyltransferase [Deltaproteobacteria bacterium]
MRLFSSIERVESKKGHSITIFPYEEKYFPSLLHMYDTYSPFGSVQGLPPINRDKRHQWAQDIISTGTNLLALHDDMVIGHASLFSMPVNWAEYFIFIHQDFQRQGIGTAITLYVIDWARQEKLSTLWLSVERKNFIAISLYRKVGFKRIASTGDSWEMILTIVQE